MPKRSANSDHMQRKSLTWIARVMEERTENVSGGCRGLAHTRKLSGGVMRCLTCRSGVGTDIVWLAGVLNVDIGLVCVDCGYLSGDVTPMLVALDRGTGVVFAAPPLRESELRTCMQLGSWHSGRTCWDRHR